MSDEREGAGPFFGFDAEDAARLAAEVQDLGFNAARMVVDRFAEMFDRFRADTARDFTSSGTPRNAGVRLGVDDGEYQRLQTDVQRALESYLAVLRRFSDASLLFFDATRSRGGSSPPTDVLILPDVGPGGRSSARMWLHNTTGSAVTDLRPWTSGLAGHTGAALGDEVVTFRPERVDRLDPAGSSEILVIVNVDEDALPGSYHGQILVEGLADAAFPLTVRVAPGPTGP